jgi:drug/metabolite transporter (DMT)-like permease
LSVTRANRRGIAALVVGMAAFTVNDALVKFVARHYPVGEIIFARGVMAVALIGTVLVARGYLTMVRVAAGGPVLLRSAFDALASGLFTAALVHMPIAELSAVALASPLLLTAIGGRVALGIRRRAPVGRDRAWVRRDAAGGQADARDLRCLGTGRTGGGVRVRRRH